MVLSKLIHKRAQIWGTDLVLASIIFSVALTGIYFYSINDSRSSEEVFENLFYDGDRISSLILSEGYPVNWNILNVNQIGILSDGKINETKLKLFYDFATADYSRTRNLFNTQYDYYFFLDGNMTIDSEIVDGIGKPDFDRYDNSSENLIKIRRVVVYQDKIVSAYLYVFK